MGSSMQHGKVKVGLIQTSISTDPDLNLERALEKAEDAIVRGARIVCLPELYRTLYFPQREDKEAFSLAETIPGDSTYAFSDLARKHEAVIIVPTFEEDRGGYYNSVAVIDADGTLLDTYRKIHIPHDPCFFEKNYFRPGNEFRVYNTRYAKFAVLICYDQWFPEAARIVALKGADIIFYPTAIGWIKGATPREGDWRSAWETVQRGHAIANSVHLVAVNRVGEEGDLIFWGSSFACDSFGNVIARASNKDEDALVVELDLGMNREVREGWGFMRNRRPELYWPIVEMCSGEHQREEKTLPCFDETPLEYGFHMPAEWERHDAVWLSWPYDLDSFPEIEDVETAYIAIIKALHEGELVNLLVKDEMMLDRVLPMLEDADVDLRKMKFHLASYADVWFRDYGPTFVVNREKKELAMVNWIFNAWGEKYTELLSDSVIPSIMNEDLKLQAFFPGIVLEGGSIDVNGRGTVLTTEQCLLSSNRNPGLGKDELESYLKGYLGARKVIWLNQGIAGDDTDGHVDDIARFVGSNVVLCAYEDDPEDENYFVLRENYEILCKETDHDGKTLQVIKLPMPGFVGKEQRLPASYANFYIGNEVVLVPVFGHANDQAALRIIQDIFPNRNIIGINCREMVHGLGAIHCISQQQPRV